MSYPRLPDRLRVDSGRRSEKYAGTLDEHASIHVNYALGSAQLT
jgi:hypothetical protein